MPTKMQADHPPIQFTTNLAEQDAREILRRDRLLAQMLLAQHQPHGPLAFNMKAGTQPEKVKSIAVTDAGALSVHRQHFLRLTTEPQRSRIRVL